MINVKAIDIKDALKNLILRALYACILILFLLIVLRLLSQNQTFAIGIVENNLQINKSEKYALDFSLLSNELNIKKNKNNNTKNNYAQTIDVDDKKYIDISSVKIWDRPKEFYCAQMPSGKIQVGNSYINSYVENKLDINKLNKVSTFEIKDGMNVLIYHTHTSESYMETKGEDGYRSQDENLNVVAIGEVLKSNLEAKKFNVDHSKQKHDTPSYNGAYSASLNTALKLCQNKKYDLIFDVHRDALAGNQNFRPTVNINDEISAKLMFVVGTNVSGLKHDEWIKNLKLALLIQNIANEMYPGLFRDLTLSKSRYNQQLAEGALIIEVGASGNTLDEAKTAMKYFANVLEALK